MKKETRKERFLREHPLCFACGDAAVTWDHLPSHACFDNRVSPKEFEFPACEPCNGATSQDEQSIALLSRVWSDPAQPAIDAEISKYMRGVSNNDRPLFENLIVDIYERKGDVVLAAEGPGVKECFNRVLPKWARAFHYLETREILPPGQVIYGRRFTVPEAHAGKVSPFFFQLPMRTLKRNGVDFQNQFSYSFRADDGFESYLVLFRRSFGAWIIIDHKRVFRGPVRRLYDWRTSFRVECCEDASSNLNILQKLLSFNQSRKR